MVRDEDGLQPEDLASAATMLQNKQAITNNVLWKRKEQLARWQSSEMNGEPLHRTAKAKVQFQDSDIFLSACMAGDEDEVDELLQKGADIDTATVDGLTAIHQSVIDSKPEMVRFLCERGADVNAQDNEGWTPLHAAACCGNITIVDLLCKRGADMAIINSDKELAVDLAEDEGCRAYLEDEYARRGIDLEMCRNQELTTMIKDVKEWIRDGHIRDIAHPRTGATALHVAAAKGYGQVLEMLLKAGADVHVRDKDGWTPLHAAAHWGEREMCTLLMAAGAHVEELNYAGQNVLAVADKDIIEFLETEKKSVEKARAVKEAAKGRPSPPHTPHGTHLTSEQKHAITIIDERSENEVLHSTAKRPHLAEESSPSEEERTPPEQAERESSSERSMSTEWAAAAPSTKGDSDQTVQFTVPLRSWNRQAAIISRSSSVASSTTGSTGTGSATASSATGSSATGTSASATSATGSGSERSSAERSTSVSTTGSAATSMTSSMSSAVASPSTTTPSKPPPWQSSTVSQESEAERRNTARMQRQHRRSTQGVTKEQLEEATKLAQEETQRRRLSNASAPTAPPPPTTTPPTTTTTTTAAPVLMCRLASAERDSDLSDSSKSQDNNQRNSSDRWTSESPSRSSPPSALPFSTAPLPSQTPSAANIRRKSSVLPNARSNRRGTGPVLAEDVAAASDTGRHAPDTTRSILPFGVSRLNGETKMAAVQPSTNSTASRTSTTGRIAPRVVQNNNASERTNQFSQPTIASQNAATYNYKLLYEKEKNENEKLKKELDETKKSGSVPHENGSGTSSSGVRRVTPASSRLANSVTKSPSTSLEDSERRSLERRISELELELKSLNQLRMENQRLKEENGALIRVISKMTI